VQFPAEVHDTESKYASGLVFCTPVSKLAGTAWAHSPLVEDCVNA
jgi:hypothetical protein